MQKHFSSVVLERPDHVLNLVGATARWPLCDRLFPPHNMCTYICIHVYFLGPLKSPVPSPLNLLLHPKLQKCVVESSL